MLDFDRLRRDYRKSRLATFGRLGLALCTGLVALAAILAAVLLWTMGSRWEAQPPPVALAWSLSLIFGAMVGAWRFRVARDKVRRDYDGPWLRTLPLATPWVTRAHRQLIARRVGLDSAAVAVAAALLAAGASFRDELLVAVAVFLVSAAATPLLFARPARARLRFSWVGAIAGWAPRPRTVPMDLAVWMAEVSFSRPSAPMLGVLALGGLFLAAAGAEQDAPMLAATGALLASHLIAWALFEPGIRASPAVAVLPFGTWRLFASMALVPAILAQLPVLLLFDVLPGLGVALLLNAGALLLNVWMMLVRFAFPESPFRGNLAYLGGVSLMAAFPPFGVAAAMLLALVATWRRPARHVLA
jgi:hypothetical protein